MKTYKFPIYILAICAALTFVACGNEDDNVIEQVTCDDGIQNGDEEGVDCGGSACVPCVTALDFSGDYVQEDAMGRPGINTVFNDNDSDKNAFNVTLHADRTGFAQKFDDRLEFYHDVYAASLDLEADDINYETNILGLDRPTFAFVLANTDALQVAPNGTTTYYDGTNALTGRTINDDVIDISLTLMFGGESGTRFDGNNDTPQLTSDGVGFGDRVVGAFPYLETPNN
ncbi:MAG: hypothetical protein ACI825_000807 [Planctomycetota bacterium]|jgi:hypothetical protein|uniref:hypothetical protein n=1 Tax=Patiriisocius sp. Uisw_047 TaxID=3230969 RepID=UPI0039E9051D